MLYEHERGYTKYMQVYIQFKLLFHDSGHEQS